MSYPNTMICCAALLVLFGLTGIVYAENDFRDVVHDTNGQIVHSTNGNCVRTKWTLDHDVCAPLLVAQQTVIQQKVSKRVTTKAARDLSEQDRTVYFSFDKSYLSDEAKSRLNTLAKILKSDEFVKEAKIVGYADRIGSLDYNDRLSQRRAETVRDYIIANGYANARVTETSWLGETKPITNCSVSEKRQQLIACLQQDRRVTVEIEYNQK